MEKENKVAHHFSGLILAALGLKKTHFGVFFDTIVSDGVITVYTRCGGENRVIYNEMFEFMKEHPCYLRDKDDDFDNSFALIYFKYPEEYANEISFFDRKSSVDPVKVWHMIQRINENEMMEDDESEPV